MRTSPDQAMPWRENIPESIAGSGGTVVSAELNGER